MTGLESLAISTEVGLLDGFDEVRASVKRAHLEGLKLPAVAPEKAARSVEEVQERGKPKNANEQQIRGACENAEERRPMSCSVMTPGGHSVRFHMPLGADVGALKGAIAARTSIPRLEQKLVAGGKQLRDASGLEHLCSGGELDVALNLGLAGGGDGESAAEGHSAEVRCTEGVLVLVPDRLVQTVQAFTKSISVEK
jgi:hypothetical protein